MRLAIITTHPIQYYAPVFRLLALSKRLQLHVFYGWEGATRQMLDPGFGKVIQWDIPLLSGYDYTFVPNESPDPGAHHFRGIVSSRLLPMVRSWGPDAVMVIGWNYRSHLNALRALHGTVPILFRGDSTLLDESPGLRRLGRRLWLSWVYRHIDVALYVGTENKRYFAAHGVEPERLVWAPHAVDNDRFAANSESHFEQALMWRRNLGIPDDGVVALFAGKLEHKKAPDVLLEAFLQVRATHENAHLIFVGSGVLEPELRKRAAGRRDVHFLGFQNQSAMPVVYRLGDIFVLPSRGPGETWGLAVNEALACGRPVIASDRVGCAADLLAGEECGLLCRAGDEKSLAAALTTLMVDGNCRRIMSEEAVRVIGHWTLQSQADRIEAAVLRFEHQPSGLMECV